MSTDTMKKRFRESGQLSDVDCRGAKIRDKFYSLPDGGGLCLWITPAGSKVWRWQYRHGGQRKLMTFGAYPAVSLSTVRELHRAARKLLAAGADPMAARKAEKQADAMTVGAVAEKWFTHWKPSKTEKHATEVWRRLELDILPSLGLVLLIASRQPRYAIA